MGLQGADLPRSRKPTCNQLNPPPGFPTAELTFEHGFELCGSIEKIHKWTHAIQTRVGQGQLYWVFGSVLCDMDYLGALHRHHQTHQFCSFSSSVTRLTNVSWLPISIVEPGSTSCALPVGFLVCLMSGSMIVAMPTSSRITAIICCQLGTALRSREFWIGEYLRTHIEWWKGRQQLQEDKNLENKYF